MLLDIGLEAVNHGLIIAGFGYIVVFFALVLLYYVFFFIPKILKLKDKKRRKKEKAQTGQEDETQLTGEVNAAISAALYLYFNELHDDESHVMTIKKVSKIYSPWSSKIYSMNAYNKN